MDANSRRTHESTVDVCSVDQRYRLKVSLQIGDGELLIKTQGGEEEEKRRTLGGEAPQLFMCLATTT